MRKNKNSTSKKDSAKVSHSVNPIGVFQDRGLATTIQQGIVNLISRRKDGIWVGNMSELDKALRGVISVKKITNWPSSPSVMRRVVNNTIYNLRRGGIGITFSRSPDYMRKRIVEFVQR